MKPTLKLSDKWGDFLVNQPETGMGYWVVTVLLHDGRRVDRVVIVGDLITEIYSLRDIPFKEKDIAEIVVTHDKWDFGKLGPC